VLEPLPAATAPDPETPFADYDRYLAAFAMNYLARTTAYSNFTPSGDLKKSAAASRSAG